jgi:hypothetical protein
VIDLHIVIASLFGNDGTPYGIRCIDKIIADFKSHAAKLFGKGFPKKKTPAFSPSCSVDLSNKLFIGLTPDELLSFASLICHRCVLTPIQQFLKDFIDGVFNRV